MSNKSSLTIKKEFKNLRKELLDLTLRNQLLNFKARAKTITIANQTTINIFQTLVLQENKMYFVANKKESDKDKSSVWDHIPFDFSKFSEGDKKLVTNLTPKELQKRLYYINNQAKTMIQEQGYNILYLAVGFLEWRDKTKPKQVNKAPLVLIPVSMERKKVGESFNLKWTEEDIQTNISLKAKLFEAGIELPDFEFKKYGEVIDHYLAKVKHSVSHMENWKVTDDIALGFFSFTKFVMYNDLNPEAWEENVDLTKNELIQAIFNPAKNDQESFREEDIDSQLEYENMYQVLDADSSQIAAIQDVKAGRNLVVEGPPGTGKSQTIVNLIAELLAEGKSVLFVSEKMAALDVVKDRLTSVGLGKFVLELHSHKTRRKKFLKELQKATNVRSKDTLNIDQTIRKLETLKRQLDDYSQIIHKPVFRVNLSAYELYGMKESAEDHFERKDKLMPLVRFENPENVTLKDLDDMKIALENLAELYQTISNENPWSKCAPKSLLPGDLREIEMLINDTLISLDNFMVERGRVYEIYGIKKPDTLNEFQNSLSAFEIIKSQNSELIDGSILKSGAWTSNNDDAFKLIQELEIYQKKSKILNKFNQSIFMVDIDKLRYDLQHISPKKFRFFNNKQHIELVERYYASNVPDNIDSIIQDLNEVKSVIQIREKLQANEALGKKYFGAYWHLNANINDLKSIAEWMHEFTALVYEGTFSKNTIDLLSNDLFSITPERDLAEYIDSGEKFVKVLSKLKDKLNPKSKLIFKRETGDVSFEAWKEQLYAWRGQLSSLHLWSQYLSTKNALKSSNAKMFVDSIEKRNIEKDDIYALVDGNFADSLLNILFVENHELAIFVGELHENRIKEFKDLDKQILTLNRKRIFHKLNSNIPKIFGGTDHPQAKILAGEFTRKSGHMPVRKLLEKAGGMIKQIKPCFMMSPLSIAQYLDPTNEELQFDVVIFDEASQVKPEDALGAFMRGKTAVVMGDTQQLPPTSFFDQMADAESDSEEATSLDMESILHLCKLSFPVRMLKWHYRSRHESLITVSNREFYDDDLLVYPSPSHSDPELGLKFHYNPNTAYLRGSSSANPLEAQDVVEEIFNHFEKYGDTKSLGVGTFSVAQKNAILEALEVKRKEHPEYEPLFADNKEERFFVKNLETIQGDERDVILISIGYGYDEKRTMSLNFGPLNQDGGERRLNVLITRAREKCVVFSNFKAYDMHLTANPPFGVKALKEFLAYAENLTLGNHEIQPHSKEPFEDAIANFLEENGYQVDRQIGCAGFRVDLAIVDDENPGRYILGITTDGKMYASSKVARDRDRLREQVLSGLGWKLYHLWSTDWYRNRELGRKKLLDFVSNSITQTREEEKRRSEEEKKLAEKRRKEAEKKAKELRLAREKEEAERKAKEQEESEENAEDIGPSDFVVVENTDEDILEKPIDVSELDPSEVFADESFENNDDISLEDENHQSGNGSVESVDVEISPNDDVDFDDLENVSSPDSQKFNEDYSDDDDLKGESTVEDVVSSDLESDDGSFESNDDVSDVDADFDDLENVSSPDSQKFNEDSSDVDSNGEHAVEDVVSSDLESDDESFENKGDVDFDDLEDVSSPDSQKFGEDSSDDDDSKDKKSVKDRIKSFIHPKNSNDDDGTINTSFGSLKFTKDLGDNSDLENNVEEDDKNFENLKDTKKSNENDKNSSNVVFDNNSDNEQNTDDINQEEIEFQYDDVLDIEDSFESGESDSTESDNETSKKQSNKSKITNSSGVRSFKSFISDVVAGESQLEPKEIKHVKGEVIEEDGLPLHKPAPNNNQVVDAEIVDLEKPSHKPESIGDGDELNIFTDDLPDLGDDTKSDDILNIVDDAKKHYIDEVFENDDLLNESENETVDNNQEYIQDTESTVVNDEKVTSVDISGDGITYYQGSNDIHSKLKKNNLHYEGHNKPKSVRDSIKGIKNDMKYINKSLKEIENPTQIDYVSVVDRTEEYDPRDYLNMPSDDDSDKILEKEEELTFAEREELRIEKEMEMEALEKEIGSDENVIIPVHEQKRKEEIKDDELENIIQSADEDYKKIEKERFNKNNKLKTFDDHKLSDNENIGDEIIDYIKTTDIGVNSQEELYSMPIDKVAQSVKVIVKAESPIHTSEVTNRFKENCNIKRAGVKLKKIVFLAIEKSEKTGDIIKIGDFLYDSTNNNVSVRKRVKPNIDLISDEEISKSIELVLSNKSNISTKQLAKETSRNFGFKSTSKKTASRINSVLDLMIADNIVKIDDDFVELV